MKRAFADGAAFIPYLAAGDVGPREDPLDIGLAKNETARYVEALVAGGADIVELGIPFSEPIADGPTIQQATVRALDAGMTADHCFDLVRSLTVDVPLVIMTYFNVIYRYGGEPGVGSFVEAAAEAGIDGLIVPDLPVEESDDIRQACDQADMALIFIAAPTTNDARLARIMEAVTGYLYVQARLGTTGSRANVSDQTSQSLDRINQYETAIDREPIPKAVGFGVSAPEHAADIVAAGADGVIVGSALVDIIAEGPTEAGSVPERLEQKAQALKRGAMAGLDRRATGPETT